jgi:circadian clock protein KaiC
MLVASTGVSGLDEILSGGLPARHTYLITGDPGSGKTTLALQFLLDGRAHGERVLYLTLSEKAGEIEAVARSHGWTLEGVDLQEIAVDERGADESEQTQTVFKPAEVELSEFRARVATAVERARPNRAAIDSLSELRLLAGDALHHRKNIMALKTYLEPLGCTTVLTDDNTSNDPNTFLHSLVHGVVALTHTNTAFGGTRRKLQVLKVRGLAFTEGLHDYVIRTGGLIVYPRLSAAAHPGEFRGELVSSGLPALDALLSGGIHRGTSVALIGPSGIGKTTTALQYVLYTANQGGKASVFLFDESLRTLRLNTVGAKLVAHIEADRVRVESLDPAELSPGEFNSRVHRAVEAGVELVVIDGLNGYLRAMPGEQLLRLHLHELLAYLNAANVTALLIVNQRGTLPPDVESELDVDYLADSVLIYRNYEQQGEVRGAIAALQHRGARLDRTLREFAVTAEGIVIGEPLRNLRGVLSGTPISTDEYVRPKT